MTNECLSVGFLFLVFAIFLSPVFFFFSLKNAFKRFVERNGWKRGNAYHSLINCSKINMSNSDNVYNKDNDNDISNNHNRILFLEFKG